MLSKNRLNRSRNEWYLGGPIPGISIIRWWWLFFGRRFDLPLPFYIYSSGRPIHPVPNEDPFLSSLRPLGGCRHDYGYYYELIRTKDKQLGNVSAVNVARNVKLDDPSTILTAPPSPPPPPTVWLISFAMRDRNHFQQQMRSKFVSFKSKTTTSDAGDKNVR